MQKAPAYALQNKIVKYDQKSIKIKKITKNMEIYNDNIFLTENIDPKSDKMQKDTADALGKLVEGVQDSFNSNKSWFDNFINHLKNNSFFQKIGNFFADILGWLAGVTKTITDGLNHNNGMNIGKKYSRNEIFLL